MELYRKIVKRIGDLVFSLVLLVGSSPVFLLITILLGFTNRGKVFFIQERPGKNARIFKLIKFKTMTDERDADGKLLSDDMRVTRAGKVIRTLSLDEIPQLINVLKGDMSLVGPRPLLVKYLHLYTPEQSRRHEVRPGITGLAQVNGRNVLSWEDRFWYDIQYVDHYSMGMDVKILWATLRSVLNREGIYPESGRAMGPFTGTGDQGDNHNQKTEIR